MERILLEGESGMSKKLHDDDKMPFGTHSGKRLGEIPDSYWLWFLKQSWCDQWPALVGYANHCVEEED